MHVLQVVFESLQQSGANNNSAVTALARACEVLYQDPSVTKAILHFLVCSRNGIKLVS